MEVQTQESGQLRLLTSKQAAELLNLTERHVQRLAKDGTLPCVRFGSKKIRFYAPSLRAWCLEQMGRHDS